MYIEFNISLNGKHFFATHERSCTDSTKGEQLKKVLQEKFPESEGYKVTASLNPQTSYWINLEEPMSSEVNCILTKISR
jgi:hypothetical protein